MKDFVHLHVHTEYSLLDGACRIKELVKHVSALGQRAIAITDHGNMYGAIEFYNACKKEGIKPIIGCEVYVAPRTRFDKENKIDTSPYHLVLLCKNMQGYKNLIKLVSIGYIEGFYSRPRVDLECLEKYSEGLICLSACLAGEILRLLSDGRYDDAKKVALRYNGIFGQGNYYIEIQDHGIDLQKDILPLLARLSAETGIPLVATNDAHYIKRSDAHMQRVLVCIATKTTLSSPSNMEFPTEEFYIKSYDEMDELFSQYTDALENTVRIADMCNVEFEFGKIYLPAFRVNDETDNKAYFRKLCLKGFEKKYSKDDKEALQRLEYEISVIEKMGYVDYFLIVWDFTSYAKRNDIPVGLGRGSGAGSICAYCIGITDVDPLKYDLLFERFLNPERVSMPDFDIDFCIVGRQQVIDYVKNKYGSDYVSQIATFNTMAARGAVRDAARAMDIPYQLADDVAKRIPRMLDISLEKALSESQELKDMYDSDARVKELIDTAKRIEGMPKSVGTHAAGIVITKEPVDSYVPLFCRDGQVLTQYEKDTLESMGLLKFDFLGLRNLTVIHECELEIRKTEPGFDVSKIPLDDKNVYDMLSRGETEGVFQFESAGMTATMVKLQPQRLEDLIAIMSLYRPGPVDSIPTYISNRHNPDKITYKHPLLKDILEVTYGCIVYQEQVMQIFRTLAGYSYGRADIVRRAMAKKKAKVLEAERSAFIYGDKNKDGSVNCVGCIANGVDEKTANELFDDMTSFASYAFNKSHAAAYSTISYQTAYLKYYYYPAYMAALMSSVAGDGTSKLSTYCADSRKINVALYPVDINKSYLQFTTENGGIRFGLIAVKNLGAGVVAEIIKERENRGDFASLTDFCSRMKSESINIRAIEALIRSGAFDKVSDCNRRQMIHNYERLMKEAAVNLKNNISGQLDMFGMMSEEVKDINVDDFSPEADYSEQELVEMEKEALGVYLSGHPMQKYESFCMAAKLRSIAEITEEEEDNLVSYDGARVTVMAMTSHIKLHRTKNGDTMAFTVCEDIVGDMEVIVFSKVYAVHRALLQSKKPIVISGRISTKEEEKPKLIAENIVSAESFEEAVMQTPLYIQLKTTDEKAIESCKALARNNAGDTKLYFYFSDIKKTVALKGAQSIKLTTPLLEEFQRVAGEHNVAFKNADKLIPMQN